MSHFGYVHVPIVEKFFIQIAKSSRNRMILRDVARDVKRETEIHLRIDYFFSSFLDVPIEGAVFTAQCISRYS